MYSADAALGERAQEARYVRNHAISPKHADFALGRAGDRRAARQELPTHDAVPRGSETFKVHLIL